MTELASSQQLRAAFLRWSLVTVPAILALGFLSGVVAGSTAENPWFQALVKPGIYPPPQTFGIVWSILYLLMGLALAMLITAHGARGRGAAIAAFAVQLVLNLAWSPLFFGAYRISAALYLLLAIDVTVLLTVVLAARVRPRAALLLLPYLAWVLFATVLNWQILKLNPEADGVPAVAEGQKIQL
ncbi:MAG: tryptophan-rich sensory protein [Sphingomonadales bacterium]|nr:tryptophan-rich sensory protein [Sphingomonadales bacterium]